MIARITRSAFMILVLLVLGMPASPALAAASRASLTDIEMNVMCVSCREPLAVAQSPQAMAERNFIRGLIARGLTEKQIENALVAQYGAAVLGRPPADGFNLTVYILPPALVVLGAALLAFTLPHWRRRSRAAARGAAAAGAEAVGDRAAAAALPPADAARLDAELAAFDR